MSKFNRFYDAARDPLAIARAAADGNLTPEYMQAGQALWGKTMPALQGHLTAAVAANKGAIPVHNQRAVGSILNQPTRPAMFAPGIQNFYTPPPMPMPNPKAGGIHQAERTSMRPGQGTKNSDRGKA